MKEREMQELDAWLAENVMEWEKQKAYFSPDLEFWFDGVERRLSVAHWHPTIDIAQAFEVVERLGKQYVIKKLGQMYSCQIIKLHKRCYRQESTLSLAICLAAKKAKKKQ